MTTKEKEGEPASEATDKKPERGEKPNPFGAAKPAGGSQTSGPGRAARRLRW